MNKFCIVACVNLKKDNEYEIEYNGSVVVFANSNDPDILLFFPISEEQVEPINFAIKSLDGSEAKMMSLGIYRTVVESLEASGKFLSGIVMDVGYDMETKEEYMSVSLAISNQQGLLDGFAKINFLHAIFISLIEKIEILITDDMLEKLIPQDDKENTDKKNLEAYPEDKNILNIVKQIMSGQVKE